MIKTAIFVEGQTELILIREFLLKWFDYNISINCFNLFKKDNLTLAEYKFSNPKSDKYFQIINVGNDTVVLQRILDQEKYLFRNGFEKIIGLRDMYSLAYRKTAKNHSIDEKVNQKFIEVHNRELKAISQNANNIHFHFAIMEIETWLWGLTKVFKKIDTKLTKDYIVKTTDFNIADDPEKVLFHPSKTLTELLQSVGKSYNKSKGDVSSFESHIEKQDYQILFESEQCQTFNGFVHTIEK